MALQVKERLPGGGFGDFIKIFSGETQEEKIAVLEETNAMLVISNIEKEMRIDDLEQQQATLLVELLEKGVL
jgi:hypothetical protein